MVDEQAEDPSVQIPSTAPTEPAVNTGGLIAAVTILINGVALFGITVFTDEQKMWILGAVGFFAPLVVGAIVRSKVFSRKSVDELTAGLIAERDRARAEAIAAREAAAALRMSMETQRPPQRQRRAQRPSEGWDEPTQQTPVRIPEPHADDSLADRRERFLQRGQMRSRVIEDPPTDYLPENTAQPQGYYQGYDQDGYAPRHQLGRR